MRNSFSFQTFYIKVLNRRCLSAVGGAYFLFTDGPAQAFLWANMALRTNLSVWLFCLIWTHVVLWRHSLSLILVLIYYWTWQVDTVDLASLCHIHMWFPICLKSIIKTAQMRKGEKEITCSLINLWKLQLILTVYNLLVPL